VTPGRALGLDLGSKRIGVAVSDAGGVLASPLVTLERTRDVAALHRRVARLVAEEEVAVVVVGLPLSLDGKDGPAAQAARGEAAALADVLPVPVVTHDERLTTVTAHQQLAAAGLDSRRRRQVVDQQAAAVLLQSWLDARRQDDDEGQDPAT
jgi:putative Holliday junction resolvase